jgi:hypothetical protein
MRTTVDIDDGVLAVVKELAQREGKSYGAVLSELARRALTAEAAAAPGVSEVPAAYGFRPLPAGGELVTNALVDKLRDEQGI